MKIFGISDTHFGHDKLVEFGVRPESFTRDILENLDKQSGDILIHCGDFCIGEDERWHEEFFSNTRGFDKHILVRGNHDNKSDNWYYEHGWDFVCRETVLKVYGKRVLFTHIPVPQTTQVARDIELNIHGHLHGAGDKSHRYDEEFLFEYNPDFHKDLAPEIRDYKSVDLSRII